MNLYNLFEAPKRPPAPGTTGVMDNQVQSAASPIGSGTSEWEHKKKPVTMMGVGNNGVIVDEARDVQLDEISNKILGDYKKAAGADASAADARGDVERGNKRFRGIVKATIKQGNNDAKKHKEQGVAEDSTAHDCKHCNGKGYHTVTKKDGTKVATNCPQCKGKGYIVTKGVAEGSLEEVDRRGFLKGMGAAAVAGAAGSAKADWEKEPDYKDPMDDSVIKKWKNVSNDGQATLRFLTHNGERQLTLIRNSGRWRPSDGIGSRPDSGRIRIDNNPVMSMLFSYAQGPANIVMVTGPDGAFGTPAYNKMVDALLTAQGRILIDASSIGGDILEFRPNMKESVKQGVAEASWNPVDHGDFPVNYDADTAQDAVGVDDASKWKAMTQYYSHHINVTRALDDLYRAIGRSYYDQGGRPVRFAAKMSHGYKDNSTETKYFDTKDAVYRYAQTYGRTVLSIEKVDTSDDDSGLIKLPVLLGVGTHKKKWILPFPDENYAQKWQFKHKNIADIQWPAGHALAESTGQDSKSWMASIQQQYPDVRFVQAKTMGAPIMAMVNGKPVAQFDTKKGVAESMGRATPKMPKARDPGHAVLAAKRSSGAGGQHTNKRRQALLQPKHQKPLTRDMDMNEDVERHLLQMRHAGYNIK